jgi:hypothetical protein
LKGDNDHPRQIWFIFGSVVSGEDLNQILYQNMAYLHNRYKSAERKNSMYVELLIAM